MKIGGNCLEPGSLVRVERARRVEKPGASNNLHGEARRDPPCAVTISRVGGTAAVSLCGTRIIDDSEPNLLQATFVAQVLGQILDAAADDRIMASRVYARCARTNSDPLFAETA